MSEPIGRFEWNARVRRAFVKFYDTQRRMVETPEPEIDYIFDGAMDEHLLAFEELKALGGHSFCGCPEPEAVALLKEAERRAGRRAALEAALPQAKP